MKRPVTVRVKRNANNTNHSRHPNLFIISPSVRPGLTASKSPRSFHDASIYSSLFALRETISNKPSICKDNLQEYWKKKEIIEGASEEEDAGNLSGGQALSPEPPSFVIRHISEKKKVSPCAYDKLVFFQMPLSSLRRRVRLTFSYPSSGRAVGESKICEGSARPALPSLTSDDALNDQRAFHVARV
jgi:hypothetical protein